MAERSFFGPGACFHHVGIAVKAIAALDPQVRVWEDAIQRVKVAFLSVDRVTLELVEPVGPDSPVARSVEKGIRVVHLCFEVPDLEVAMLEGQRHGFRQLTTPAPAPAFEGRRILWVFSQDYGLIELLEAPAT